MLDLLPVLKLYQPNEEKFKNDWWCTGIEIRPKYRKNTEISRNFFCYQKRFHHSSIGNDIEVFRERNICSTDYVPCIVYAKKIVILISSRGFLCYLELKTEIPIRTILELFIMYSCTMTLDLMEMHLWLQTFWRTRRNLMMSFFSVVVICFVSVIQLLSTLQLFQYIISEKITLWRIDPSDEKWTVFQSRLYYA